MSSWIRPDKTTGRLLNKNEDFKYSAQALQGAFLSLKRKTESRIKDDLKTINCPKTILKSIFKKHQETNSVGTPTSFKGPSSL
jgi:hypothetical protein